MLLWLNNQSLKEAFVGIEAVKVLIWSSPLGAWRRSTHTAPCRHNHREGSPAKIKSLANEVMILYICTSFLAWSVDDSNDALMILVMSRCFWSCRNDSGNAVMILGMSQRYWWGRDDSGGITMIQVMPWCFWWCSPCANGGGTQLDHQRHHSTQKNNLNSNVTLMQKRLEKFATHCNAALKSYLPFCISIFRLIFLLYLQWFALYNRSQMCPYWLYFFEHFPLHITTKSSQPKC